MNRFMSLIPISLLTILLSAGCANEVRTYTDVGQTITVGVNQEFIIALSSNPTTGYNWEEKHDAAMLSLIESKYEPDKKAPGLVGAGGTHYFRFKALKGGKTEITLTYKRPWETTIGEQRIFKIHIK